MSSPALEAFSQAVIDMARRQRVFDDISGERRRQIEKHGGSENPGSVLEQKYLNYDACMAVLTEEVGEVARAINDHDREGIERELIQVAAVAVAWVESMRRKR